MTPLPITIRGRDEIVGLGRPERCTATRAECPAANSSFAAAIQGARADTVGQLHTGT